MSRGLLSCALAALLTLALGCEGRAVFDNVDGSGEASEPRTTWYVSRHGDGSTGRSWETAWSELSAINWNVVEPGDHILIDGGEESMRYETVLRYGASGRPGRPIVLRVSDEEGHNGQAIFHGGRKAMLPYCGQTDFERPDPTLTRATGIETAGHSWVLLDGGAWRRLLVTAYVGAGVQVAEDSEHLTFKHVELFDNGAATWRTDGTWYPFGAGVRVAGHRVLFERSLIHDNGGDALRSEGGLSRLVLRRTWLYNSRPHPTLTDEPFNHCAQSDGLHLASGGEQYGLNVEASIIGPGFQNGLLLGDARQLSDWATLHDVVVTDTLLLSHKGASATSNISAMQPPQHPPRNWRLERVTSVRPASAKVANIAVRGAGHVVKDSVFAGGEEVWLESPQAERNCLAVDRAAEELGENLPPDFANADHPHLGTGFAAFDYALTWRSECEHRGSRITSVATLMSEGELEGLPNGPPPPPPNVLPEVSFLAPTEGAAVAAGQPVAIAVTAEDSDGAVVRVEFYAGPELVGTVGAPPYTLTFIPPPGQHLFTVRAFDDDGEYGEGAVTVMAEGPGMFSLDPAQATLSGGFELVNGCIRQTTNTAVTAGGRAEFTFTVETPGTFEIRGVVTAPSNSENSFFVNVDEEPVAGNIWDLKITADPQEQSVTWRGSGSESEPEFSPRTFDLAAGEHTLILRGREPNSCVGQLTLIGL